MSANTAPWHAPITEPTAHRVGTPALRRWRLTTTNGLVFSGPLTWSQDDPSHSGVPPESVAQRLADIAHFAESAGFRATLSLTSLDCEPSDAEVLWASVIWRPLAADQQRRTPYVRIEIVPECWSAALDLDGYDALIHQLRARLDTLDRDIRPLLAAALEEDAHNRAAQGVLETHQESEPQEATTEPRPVGACTN